ncbi:MAG TPA: oligosaccharide flippase family protein, partial [Longimicrobiaceae bacterium]
MQSEFRKVGRHTLVYGMGVALGSLASFLMLPIYTRYLTTSDYGVLELLGMTIDVIGMIAGVGLAAAVFKFHSELETEAERRRLLSTAAIGMLALALATSLVGAALAGLLNQVVFKGAQNPLYFRVFFLIYFLQAATAPALILLRIRERSLAFVAVNLAKLVLSLALNIYFVVVRRMGVEGVLASTTLVNGVLGIGLAAYTFRSVGFSFSLPRFRQLTAFGAPLVVVSLGSFVLTFSDRYFLNWFADTGSVGVYALAYRFTFMLSTLTVVPFSQIWEPRRFEVAKRPDAGDVYRRMFVYYSMALVGGATLMTAVIRDVLAIMVAPEFLGAYRVVPLILIATVLQQWAAYACVGLYLRSRTNLLAWASVIAVVVTLLLNALLIPRWGIMGAAWATVGAYVVRFVFTYAFSQAHYPIRYPWGRVSVLVAVFFAVYAARMLVVPRSLGASIPYSLLLGLATLLVYYQVLDAGERSAIRGFLRRLRPALPAE